MTEALISDEVTPLTVIREQIRGEEGPVEGSFWNIAMLPVYDTAMIRIPPEAMGKAARSPAGTINDLAIVEAVRLAKISLDRPLQLEETDRAPGDGVLRLARNGYTLPLGKVLELALVANDATARRLAVRAADGPMAINDRLSDPASELHDTLLELVDPSDNSPEATFTMGFTTAAESAILLHRALYAPKEAAVAVPVSEYEITAWSHNPFNFGLRREIERVELDVTSGKHPFLASLHLVNDLGLRIPTRLLRKLMNHTAPLTAYPNIHDISVDEGTHSTTISEVCQIGNLIVSVTTSCHGHYQGHVFRHPALNIFSQIGATVHTSQGPRH